MKTNDNERLVPIEGYIDKKISLIVFGLIFPGFIAQTFLKHLFIDSGIPVFSIMLLLILSPMAFRQIRKAQKFVSMAYFWIPGVFSLLMFYFVYSQLASQMEYYRALSG